MDRYYIERKLHHKTITEWYSADEVDTDKAKDMAIIQGLNIDLSAKKIRLEKMKARIRELEEKNKRLRKKLSIIADCTRHNSQSLLDYTDIYKIATEKEKENG